jgi:hypothetical protein
MYGVKVDSFGFGHFSFATLCEPHGKKPLFIYQFTSFNNAVTKRSAHKEDHACECRRSGTQKNGEKPAHGSAETRDTGDVS